MYFRVANALYYLAASRDLSGLLQSIAHKISMDAVTQTGVEIHPAAKIGERFVVDHGIGTVVGETTTIGHDCYILQGVVLGALGVAQNFTGKRHPTIGNKVEIASFAKLLGPIVVGDNVFIGPHCIITKDIPAHSRVTLMAQYQIEKGGSGLDSGIVIYGIVPEPSKKALTLYGENLRDVDVTILDGNFEIINDFTLTVTERTPTKLILSVACTEDSPSIQEAELRMGDELCLGLSRAGEIVFAVRRAIGLHKCLQVILATRGGR